MTSTLLVVDDEKSIRGSLRFLMEYHGYTVYTASTATEALHLLERHPVDVMLLDIVLPDTTGVDLLKQIRQPHPLLPVIMMTGLPTLETATEALRLGAFDYLQKPIDNTRIQTVVANAVRLKRLSDEKQRLEKENEAGLQRYQHIVSSSHDLLAFIALDYRYLAANRAYREFFEKSTHEIIGRHMQDIVGKRFFQSTVKPHIERVLNGEKMFGQRKVRLPNGQTRHIDSAYYPHRDAEGRIIGIISSIRDITDMKKMEKKLQQAQKMEAMGTLAGGVAHDFNNILFSIIGFSELAREYLPPDSPASGHIDEVLASALRATELVKQILAFARQAETRRKPLAVNLLLKEALKMLRASLPTTIQIIQDVQPVPAVIADPTQIHQIIMNLCTNAAHAMQQTGGTLTVRLHVGLPPFVGEDAAASSLPPESIPVCLSVKDTGHGMSPHILTNIFDPYFTTKDKSEGTGLGLAMVHGIVSEMNGYIHVDSAPGQGTTFAICLPAAEKLAKDGYLGPDETVTGGKERILFVDDEPGLVKLNQQRLCHLGYEVVGRTSSIEALNRFQARPDAFDLIISDLTMPNMTGLELAAEMRRIRPDIPFILCTGFSSKLKRPEMDSLDIDEVIMKPIVVAHMAQTIRKVLDRQNR